MRTQPATWAIEVAPLSSTYITRSSQGPFRHIPAHPLSYCEREFSGSRPQAGRLSTAAILRLDRTDSCVDVPVQCQALHEMTMKGFLGLEMLYIISEADSSLAPDDARADDRMTRWRRQITSLVNVVIESSCLDNDLSILP
ncbi:BZ3500_MvSof-1268-A1-R1_Chr9g10869 [Microbotryum saponariae]|uniref:BZ3500_MvSof-1268-A1-R1_Chr9g10869 protein n=1 Tax=Microbotryum saponariae TaxID=289078 RepID=A0A2X0L2P9_9BASI|nr:BZ3501_MvSof-1269-A2-R1_Chr9g10617 [Microbotryum saponariae]SDA00834.1 BZ3500_MvSof-1268-A1-R1_Chr9g10869 [Microbotryum saponariae]